MSKYFSFTFKYRTLKYFPALFGMIFLFMLFFLVLHILHLILHKRLTMYFQLLDKTDALDFLKILYVTNNHAFFFFLLLLKYYKS